MVNRITPSQNIYISESKIDNAGLGVFAARNIKMGEIIENCPIILLDEPDIIEIRKTRLHNYYFMWGVDERYHKGAICLGFGSIYNHSYSPNATYRKVFKDDKIEFIAIKNIGSDEEITANYNHGKPDDKTRLWIEEIPPAE